MTRIIMFDTETTGLPVNKKESALISSNNWPDIVSICWMVFENRTLVRTENHIISPNGWIIPEESIRIHGITQERAQAEGRPLEEVLNKFRADIESACYIIAHNLQFDKNVVFNAYMWRLNMNPMKFWNTDAEFCTQEASKDEMKLRSLYGRDYKFPKLDELYKDTFKKDAPADAHNAMRDTQVLQQIVWERWNLADDNGVLI